MTTVERGAPARASMIGEQLVKHQTSAAPHRTRTGNASDGVASSPLTGRTDNITPRMMVTNLDTVQPADNDKVVRQSNLHTHRNRATCGGSFERSASFDSWDNKSRSEPIINVAPPAKHRKRETLPDIARRIPVDSLRPFLQLPLVSAAKAMGISATTLKRLCRHYGIKRWPHRQISGIDRAVERLQAELEATAARGYPSSDVFAPIAAHIHELSLHRQGMVELALEGGHESVRAKLASVGVFVNTIQGSREARAARSPNQEANRSISGRKDDRNDPQPRQHATFELPADSSSPARPSRYRGGTAGYSTPTSKAKGMMRMQALNPKSSAHHNPASLAFRAGSPPLGPHAVGGQFFANRSNICTATAEEAPASPYQDAHVTLHNTKKDNQTALGAVAPLISAINEARMAAATGNRNAADGGNPRQTSLETTAPHLSFNGIPSTALDTAPSVDSPSPPWSNDGIVASNENTGSNNGGMQPPEQPAFSAGEERFPSPGSPLTTLALSPAPDCPFSPSDAESEDDEHFVDDANDLFVSSCHVIKPSLKRCLDSVSSVSSGSITTYPHSSPSTCSFAKKWNTACGFDLQIWGTQDNEAPIPSDLPSTPALFGGSSLYGAGNPDAAATATLSNTQEDVMTLEDFKMLEEMAFGYGLSGASSTSNDTIDGEIAHDLCRVGVPDTMNMPSWRPPCVHIASQHELIMT